MGRGVLAVQTEFVEQAIYIFEMFIKIIVQPKLLLNWPIKENMFVTLVM